MDIPTSLKKIRNSKNLTLNQVAEATGIPFRTYQSYELNLRKLSLDNAFALAKFYKVSIEKLCNYDK